MTLVSNTEPAVCICSSLLSFIANPIVRTNFKSSFSAKMKFVWQNIVATDEAAPRVKCVGMFGHYLRHMSTPAYMLFQTSPRALKRLEYACCYCLYPRLYLRRGGVIFARNYALGICSYLFSTSDEDFSRDKVTPRL